jgi:hypothetical protein
VSVVGNEMHREFVLDRIVNHQLVQLPNTPRAKIIPLYGVLPGVPISCNIAARQDLSLVADGKVHGPVMRLELLHRPM